MSVAQGYEFEREVVRSGHLLKMHIRKIPTSIFGDHKVQGTYDVFLVSGGIFVAAELKEQASADRFAFARVQANQEEELAEAHNSGGRAFILVNYRVNRKLKVYAIPLYEWLALKKDLGRKSIPYEKFAEFLEVPDIRAAHSSKTPVWDLSVLTKCKYNRRANVKVCHTEKPPRIRTPRVRRGQLPESIGNGV